jgi:hypothetical protein
LIVEQALTYLLLAVLAYFWLGLPVGNWWQVALVFVSGLLWIAALLFSARRAIRQLRCQVPRLPSFQRTILSLLLAGAGIACMVVLLGWVPAVQGLAVQAISLAIRFGIAYAVLIGCWLMVAALLSGGIPQPGQDRPQAEQSQ